MESFFFPPLSPSPPSLSLAARLQGISAVLGEMSEDGETIGCIGYESIVVVG